MEKHITQDIVVKVQPRFEEISSGLGGGQFEFSYLIFITNRSEHTVKLLTRHWKVVDGFGQIRKVNGEGVLGRQPVLEPGQSHDYISGCNFVTPFGRMQGHYTMERLTDGDRIKVKVPSFDLVAPFMLN